MSSLRHTLVVAALVSVCINLAPSVAGARIVPVYREAEKPAVIEKPPGMLILADRMNFEDAYGIASASGNVEISYGERVLLADQVIYERDSGIVTAIGNVRLLESTGEVVFSDWAQLTGNLAEGYADRIRILMTDNGRLAAEDGERFGERWMRLRRAVYSPCDLCKDDPEAPPLWQIKAKRVTHDHEAKDVIYRDAFLEMAGIPVLYSPYFSHPDPTVERRSGFITPTFGSRSSLGTYGGFSYYGIVDRGADMTITPLISANDGLQLSGQWRQNWDRTQLVTSGSIVHTDRQETNGSISRDQLRGHNFGTLRYELGPDWRGGADWAVATDSSYLSRYDIYAPDILNNRLYAEGFYGRSYVVGNVWAFQDTRPGFSTEAAPVVLPDMSFQALGDPGKTLGGRWEVQGGVLALNRNKSLATTRRADLEASWQRRVLPGLGLVTVADVSMRQNAWWSENMPDARRPDGIRGTDLRTRFFPSAHVTTSYPLVNPIDDGWHLWVEPLVSVTAATETHESLTVPNEDSQDIEFDVFTLMRRNRFSGIDRQDGGGRATWGGRTAIQGPDHASAEIFLGQSYRFYGDGMLFPENSGLRREVSDLVGLVRLQPSSWLDFDYTFRLDQKTLDARRQDIMASMGPDWLKASAVYLFSARTPNLAVNDTREEIAYGINGRFWSYWTMGGGQRYDLSRSNGLLTTSLTGGYQDECLTFSVTGSRDHTARADVESGDSIMFRILFKNLGGVETQPTSATSLMGDQRSGL